MALHPATPHTMLQPQSHMDCGDIGKGVHTLTPTRREKIREGTKFVAVKGKVYEPSGGKIINQVLRERGAKQARTKKQVRESHSQVECIRYRDQSWRKTKGTK